VRDSIEEIDEFVNRLKTQAIRKSQLYDGINNHNSPDECLRYAIEELGEIATAMTRERINSAMDECFDLAHCAMLLWLSLKQNR
jgi:hypothetical protein